nr:hypothetical protein [Tanacetum cinerariifolium]
MHILVILSLVLRVNDLDEELEEENADYANEPEEEDPEEEDPEEEDPKEEESNDNAASEEEPLEGFDDTELSKEDKTAVTPPPSRLRGARISIHPQTPMPPLYEARNESLEAHNRSLVARIETIETRMTEIEDQFQDTRDYAVSHVMHTQALEARAQIDTMEDAGSSC